MGNPAGVLGEAECREHPPWSPSPLCQVEDTTGGWEGGPRVPAGGGGPS